MSDGLRLGHSLSDLLDAVPYRFVRGADFQLGPGPDTLARCWNGLPRDPYLPDGGDYRYRRFSSFVVDLASREMTGLPHRPYFQSREVNRLIGGIERVFEPLPPAATTNEFLRGFVLCNLDELSRLADHPAGRWNVNVHMVRIVGTRSVAGKPTPEGIHHDGTEFSSFHLMDRVNVVGGDTRIYDTEKNELASCTLLERMDSCYLIDAKVMHAVSPISAAGDSAGWRDMLLLGYRRAAVPD